ncbi:MAG: holo-[acyl-carrier protein] synthase [Acidimicrobiaceae bacterium]|nr:holo-[acyl-carrier protein] synthase [Acidimicrobiaceae bacterium]
MIGLGIDAVDIGRFRTVLARRPGLAERLFTAGERAYAAGQADPAPSLAARFAAKEAAMKALGVGLGAFRWTDVEVVRLASGQPALRMQGAAAALASKQGVGKFLVSLTHTSSQAEAVVAALA